MATPSEKLANSLEILKQLQDTGTASIRSNDLTRTHRERLIKHGFMQEVMKGWYISSRPNENAGESTAWYASYWSFCASYLTARFGNKWCLSPEQSILIHAGNSYIPKQLLVRTPKANNKITKLPHDTSLFEVQANMPATVNIDIKDELRLFWER
jgi:hypothetical protein